MASLSMIGIIVSYEMKVTQQLMKHNHTQGEQPDFYRTNSGNFEVDEFLMNVSCHIQVHVSLRFRMLGLFMINTD